jgi:two-component system alkaline phosphatase synthesis response regulator PhoP
LIARFSNAVIHRFPVEMRGSSFTPQRTEKAIDTDTPHSDSDTIIRIEDLRVDIRNELVSIGDDLIPVTATEFRILRTLMVNSSWVVRRHTLISAIHNTHTHATSKSIHVHISRLRTKLQKYGKWIRTFKGIGYRFLPGE